MTTQTQTAPSVGRERKVNRPLALIVLSVCLAVMLDPSAFDVVVASISEAYLAVATFVAATLLVFFSLERLFKFDLTEINWLSSPSSKNLKIPFPTVNTNNVCGP